jgi:hypothetical protein
MMQGEHGEELINREYKRGKLRRILDERPNTHIKDVRQHRIANMMALLKVVNHLPLQGSHLQLLLPSVSCGLSVLSG